MLRSLPPAGHPIELKQFLSFCREKSNDTDFLKGWNPELNYFYVNSGSSALVLALEALQDFSSRTQVILPAYTCPSVMAAVVYCGLQPVLCDMEPTSFQMDLGRMASIMNSETLAVIAVHLFGLPENIAELKALTCSQGVYLIEDAAQAFGNKVPFDNLSAGITYPSPLNSKSTDLTERSLGSFGDIGIFSFGRGKPLTLMSGGAVLVNNLELQESAQKLYYILPKNSSFLHTFHYFINLFLYSILFKPNLYWIPQGIPWLRLGETIFTTEIKVKRMIPDVTKPAVSLLSNFSRVRNTRLELAKVYTEKLRCFENKFLLIPKIDSGDIALLRFPILFTNSEKRKQALNELKIKRLGATGMYPASLNKQSGASDYILNGESYPNAEIISQRIMTLPLHEEVKKKDMEQICKIIARILSQ